MMSLPSVAAWSWVNNYRNDYNITVANWTYNAAYGSNTFTSFDRTGYVLVNLTNLGDPSAIQVNGYSNSLTNLGRIPYYYVNRYANTTLLLLRNVTNICTTPIHCSAWSKATVFYRPVNPSLAALNSTLLNPNCLNNICFKAYNGISFILIGNASLYTNLNTTPPYSNRSVARLNFTPTQPTFINKFIDLIVLTNNSLSTRNFFVNETRDVIGKFGVSGFSGRYKFQSFGVGGGLVTSPDLKSRNANLVFNSVNGFEGRFSWLSSTNAIVTEQTGTNVGSGCLFNCGIFNSSSTNTLGYYPSLKFPFLDIAIDTNVPTQFIIMPAFTTNYLTSNSNNPNAFSNNCGSVTIWNNGTYCDFQYKTVVNNINWTVAFKTKTCASGGCASPFVISGNVITANNVPFLELTVPHSSAFIGPDCLNVQMGMTKPLSILNDTIPFYLEFVNKTFCKYILQNRTLTGFAYNSLYVFVDSVNATDYTNTLLQNKFIIASGTTFSVPIAAADGSFGSPSNMPALITMPTPFTPNSFIRTDGAPNINFFHFGLFDYLSKDTPPASPGTINVLNPSLIDDNKILLYSDTGPTGFPRVAFYMTDMSGIQSRGTVTYSNNSNSVAFFGGSDFNPYPTKIISNSINQIVVVRHIATGNYNASWLLQNSKQTLITNNSGTPLLKVNGTTTIIFNPATAVLTTIATGVSIPSYIFAVLGLLLMIFGATMFSNHNMGDFPVMMMIAGIWLSGVWNFGLVIVALIFTILFILYEYTKHRKHSDTHATT
jgi:hypothetical protein